LDRLDQDAAQQTFIDIADSSHDPEDVDKILALTDNMPLAINLLAHLVDSEGCSSVLSHWAKEKTSLVSEGYDRRSNLDLSISLSLSSPRLQSVPQSRKLLSLLSMLPDGLSDAELIQSRLPIDDILGCKAALIRTTLAYSDEHKRLKVLVPIREYMQTTQPPCHNLIQPLLKFFQELLQFFAKYRETQVVSRTVAQILSNYTNIQNVLQNALRHHPDLINSIYLVFHLNKFSQHVGRGFIPWIQEIKSFFPKPCDHRLEVYFIINMLDTYQYYRISDPETLLSHALEHFNHFDDPDLKCMPFLILVCLA
jgi:hypothetical protein